jgi:hypothetical protein
MLVVADVNLNCFLLQRVTEHPKHGSPGTANYIDARTTWFDQAVEGATKLGLSQVVVIAAGFDSRAYRLHASGMQVYISIHTCGQIKVLQFSDWAHAFSMYSASLWGTMVTEEYSVLMHIWSGYAVL